MKSKISQILEDIRIKKEELFQEYEKLKQEYGFTIDWKKIIFNSETKKKNKLFKEGIIDFIFSARVRAILSAPFIYSMIFPSIILHIFLWFFQQTAFRLYKIPIVSIKDYVVFDRKELDYLNFIQKINCHYCSYVNWLYSYSVEVAWRTERYWCPIKNAKKMKWWHDWQEHFADYWDPEEFRACFTNPEIFSKNNDKK